MWTRSRFAPSAIPQNEKSDVVSADGFYYAFCITREERAALIWSQAT